MANRRMFSLSVTDTDDFLDMPVSSQLLYFHLGMRADDDGFVSSPRKIIKSINVGIDDLKLLIVKGYVIWFNENKICVITHWKLNNYIQTDRYTATIYKNEYASLSVAKNTPYSLRIQSVYKMDTQDSIGKDSIGEDIFFNDLYKNNNYKIILTADAKPIKKECESENIQWEK